MAENDYSGVKIHSSLDELHAFSRDRIWNDMQAVLKDLKEIGILDLRDPETDVERLNYIRGGLTILDEMLVMNETMIEFKKRQLEEIENE